MSNSGFTKGIVAPKRARRIDRGERKEVLELREKLRIAEKKIEDQEGTVRNTSRDYVRTMDDNSVMRVEGHQPLPALAAQRRMMGDGTNPFMRYK